MRAAHLHFMVASPRFRTLVTHIFVRGDSHVESDTVFGVRDSLVKDFERQGAPSPTGGTGSGRGCGSTSCWRQLRSSSSRVWLTVAGWWGGAGSYVGDS
ncbi:hypothetical protein AB0E59_17610 [Lentzea sp. NPDC034063]|uniref:dioxygenase family protein n=1 Tax=unclassified Lentzea TaxID=2643253 RepID=UPI0033D5B364